MSSNRIYLLLMLLIVGAFVPAVLWRDFLPLTELKYLDIAQDALARGNFFAFYYDGEPYTSKPPFYLWLCMMALSLGHNLSFPFLLLISVLSWISIIILCDRFFGFNFRHQERILIILGMCSMLLADVTAVVARMDVLFTAVVLFAYIRLIKRYELLCALGNTPRVRLKYGNLQIPLLLFLAIFIKGPYGLLFPFTALLFVLWYNHDLKRLFKVFRPYYFIIILFCMGLWALGVYLESGSDYLYELFWSQSLRCLEGDSELPVVHAEPFYYYFKLFLPLTLPVGLCAVYFLIRQVKGRICLELKQQACLFFVLAVMLVVSIPSYKLEICLLPALPSLYYYIVLSYRQLHQQLIQQRALQATRPKAETGDAGADGTAAATATAAASATAAEAALTSGATAADELTAETVGQKAAGSDTMAAGAGESGTAEPGGTSSLRAASAEAESGAESVGWNVQPTSDRKRVSTLTLLDDKGEKFTLEDMERAVREAAEVKSGASSSAATARERVPKLNDVLSAELKEPVGLKRNSGTLADVERTADEIAMREHVSGHNDTSSLWQMVGARASSHHQGIEIVGSGYFLAAIDTKADRIRLPFVFKLTLLLPLLLYIALFAAYFFLYQDLEYLQSPLIGVSLGLLALFSAVALFFLLSSLFLFALGMIGGASLCFMFVIGFALPEINPYLGLGTISELIGSHINKGGSSQVCFYHAPQGAVLDFYDSRIQMVYPEDVTALHQCLTRNSNIVLNHQGAEELPDFVALMQQRHAFRSGRMWILLSRLESSQLLFEDNKGKLPPALTLSPKSDALSLPAPTLFPPTVKEQLNITEPVSDQSAAAAVAGTGAADAVAAGTDSAVAADTRAVGTDAVKERTPEQGKSRNKDEKTDNGAADNPTTAAGEEVAPES